MQTEPTIASKTAFKPGPIIAIGIMILAMAFAAFQFKGSQMAYLPFKQAIASASEDSTVQVIGAPVKDETRYDQTSGQLDFTLVEPATGATLPVIFKSPKPDNFDEAIQITAQGKYNAQARVFEASNLLVKCPSKYAGQKQPGAGATQRAYGAGS